MVGGCLKTGGRVHDFAVSGERSWDESLKIVYGKARISVVSPVFNAYRQGTACSSASTSILSCKTRVNFLLQIHIISIARVKEQIIQLARSRLTITHE